MPIIPDITRSPLTRDQYLSQERQGIIDRSLINSNNRVMLDAPLLKTVSEEEWREMMNNHIEMAKRALEGATDPQQIDYLKDRLKEHEDMLASGYVGGVSGPNCIWIATGNFGKPYQVSGNQSFRANPLKYGFQEISLDDIKPGDIIQDFTRTNNVPHHALTFIGYDNEGKARFNYSRGGTTESDNKKNALYPFFWDDDVPKVHLDGKNNSKLAHAAAAYRFVGNQEDNIRWNNDYNDYRTQYNKALTEHLKSVPKIDLPTTIDYLKYFNYELR